MKILTVLLLIFVIYIASAKKSPGPLFMWSNKETFNPKKINIMNVESNAIEKILENIVSISDKQGDLTKYLNKDSPLPEVITIFLKPTLTSSKFSQSADVYNGGKDGSFTNLQNLVKTSQSSLSVHYSYLKESFATDVLSKFTSKLSEIYPNAKTILSSVDKNDVSHFPSTHRWIPISTLEEFLVSGEGKNYVLNGTPDILIVYLSKDESKEIISNEDNIIGIVSNILSVSTDANSIGIFSSDVPEQHEFPSISNNDLKDTVFQYNIKQQIKRESNDSDVAGTYFPPQMWQAIFVVIVLLIAFFLGLSATSSLQIPPKLLDEKMAKKKNN